MKVRLLACIAGGIAGLGVALMAGDGLELPQAVVRAGGALSGMAIGYFASAMFDVFTSEEALMDQPSADASESDVY